MNTSSLSVKRTSNPLVVWLFSSIGKKTMVAVTGILLVLFVAGHLVGNLTFFVGPDVINTYAKKLHELGPILWVIRLGLLAVVGLHIYFTMLLWKENRTARPSKYKYKTHVQSTIFSRTMRLSGIVILAFVVFHLAHFTLRVIDPAYSQMRTMVDGHEVMDVYRMIVTGFSVWWVSVFYVISLGLVAFHLSHGISSLFQTLGLSNRRLRPTIELGGKVLAWALFIGFSSIPISILIFGLGKEALK
jgi:succinate dehydrogenase / fumarate reductase cytochrome b subunit